MTEAEVCEYIAKRVPIVARRQLSVETLRRSKPNAFLDPITLSMVLDLRSFVHAMPAQRVRISRHWPKDWWQAVKDRWFPRWAKAYWPVEYDGVEVDEPLFSAVCPHIQDDGQREHLRWLAMKSDEVARP